MAAPAILVEQLGKRYRIGRAARAARTWPAALAEAARGHFRRLAALAQRGADDEFIWALRDAAFEVWPGEVVGVIGRNGAGKSTLLKILARIVEPTTGRALLHGRVGSLLEVGTGFHPELTGRENIYLCGAVLGMRRAEIRRVFDEIVAFADIPRFLDTPVKRYSSGMYTRLAFAVAAHLEPEILLVDEVLAVGDAAFQKKCLGKMGDVAQRGRTVLLVSHQMAAIENLCKRALLLREGRLVADDAALSVINRYLTSDAGDAATRLRDRRDRTGTGRLRFTAVRLRDAAGRPLQFLATGRPAVLELAFEAPPGASLRHLHVAVGIDNSSGLRVACLSTEAAGQTFAHVPPGAAAVTITIGRLPLLPGRYHLTLYATLNGVVADWVQNAGHFDVEPGDFYATGKLPPQGAFCMDCDFALRAPAPLPV